MSQNFKTHAWKFDVWEIVFFFLNKKKYKKYKIRRIAKTNQFLAFVFFIFVYNVYVLDLYSWRKTSLPAPISHGIIMQ
jgi:hypothetical protein